MAKYIDNERFEELIVEFRSGDRTNEEELMLMFYTLIDKIIGSFSYNVSKEDATQECLLLILQKLKAFDPKKGTAFNFFTTSIINNLKRLYTKNKRYEKKIDNYIDHLKDESN